MYRNRRGLPLQQEVNTDEQWERLLQREGLIIVDVYSGWCGPCSAMVNTLKKIKRGLGDPALHLAIAKSDSISCLKELRNKSEPTWLFIAEGKVVNAMFGANAPKLMCMISEELKREAAVKTGACERAELEIINLPKEKVTQEDPDEPDDVPQFYKVNDDEEEDEFLYCPF